MALVAVVHDDPVRDDADHAQAPAVLGVLVLVLDLWGRPRTAVVRDRHRHHLSGDRDGQVEADRSLPGIALAALSLAVMPFLSAAQRRAGRELGSASAVADSQQTLLCTYLSAVLLIGLVLNATLGWSWADPTAALAIAVIAAKEGRDTWRGKGCCAAPPAAAARADSGADACGCGC